MSGEPGMEPGYPLGPRLDLLNRQLISTQSDQRAPTPTVTPRCGCSTSPALADKRLLYDGNGTIAIPGQLGSLGSTGQLTATQEATSYSGNTAVFTTESAMTYDSYGRITQTLDVDSNPTTTTFSGTAGELPNGLATKNSQGWKTTAVIDPLRGITTESSDANSELTDTAYDALGRKTAVWLPGRSKAGGQSADETFSYAINPGAQPGLYGTITTPGSPSAVTTSTLQEGGGYSTSVTLYDGMLQPRETQSTPGGEAAAPNGARLVSDTFYDSHGWAVRSYAPYYDSTANPGTTLSVAKETAVPAETVTLYDGLGRATNSQLYHQGVLQWQSTTAYPGVDESTSTAPAGGPSTATFTDALGETTSSVVQNTSPTVKLTPGQIMPSGTSLSSDSVRLTMQADGNLVLTALASGKQLWSTGTSGNPGAWAQFGTDGNLAVETTIGTQLWSSGLAAGTGTVLQIQDDANVAINNSSGSPAWSSNTGNGAAEADSTTSYTYKPSGQVATIKDSAGNTWSYSYNMLGQKTSATDPNTGTTTYGPYDAEGNLEQTTDARGQTLSYYYDWDNRLVKEYTGAWTTSPAATSLQTSYVYDTLDKGLPTSSTRYSGTNDTAQYTESVTGYNAAYQPKATTVSIPSTDGFPQPPGTTAPSGSGTTTFTVTPSYSTNIGLLNTVQYNADGGLPAETVSYSYNAVGEMTGFGGWISSRNVPAYLDSTSQDPYGRTVQSTYGRSGEELTTAAAYDDTTGRLDTTTASLQAPNTTTDDVNYRYDQAGDVTAIDDLQNGATAEDTQCFTYDSFQRLTQAWTDTKGITSPGSTTVGNVGSCNTATPQTTTTAPVATTTIGDSAGAAYWQTYTYDLLGDRTGMVNHDTTGNAANNTTQTTAYAGSDGTTAAADPDQATGTTTSNPSVGTSTQTPGYLDPNSTPKNQNAGDTVTRTTNSGPLSTGLKSTTTGTTGQTLCASDAGSATTPGTAQVTAPCQNNSAGSAYTLASTGALQVLGMCLDTVGEAKAAGTAVVLNTCNSADTTQTWQTGANNTLIDTGAANLCLTDPAASTANGTPLTIAACGTTGQSWTTVGATTGTAPGTDQTLTYNAEGMTAGVTTTNGTTSQTTSYLYDADGNLLEQTAPGTKILYLFGGAEQITQFTANGNTAVDALRNYVGPDGTTITRDQSGNINYQLGNAQGTATTLVNAGTDAVTRRYYDPYGNPRGTTPTTWGSVSENRGYLGQPTDTTTGLDLLGARNYDPAQGRFLSPDPIFEAGDPNQMGGYSYSGDNPSTGSDPNGDREYDPDTGLSAGTTSDLTKALGTEYYGADNANEDKWQDFVGPIIGGAAVGVGLVVGGVCIADLPGCIVAGAAGAVDMSSGGSAMAMQGTVGASSYLTAAIFGGMEEYGAPLLSWIDGESAGAAPASAGASGEPTAAQTAEVQGLLGKTDSGFELKPAKALDTGGTDPAAAGSGTKPTTPAAGTGDAPPVTSKCSFSPDTPVLLASGKSEPIGKLKVGDKVESANPNTSKEEGGRTVQHIWINHDTDLLDVTVSTGHGHTAVIHTTANHPFWDNTAHAWVAAGELKPGHQLASTAGQQPMVVSVRVTPGAANRYNLTIQQLHTYYVVAGATPILVHNTNCGPDPTWGGRVRWVADEQGRNYEMHAYVTRDMLDEGTHASQSIIPGGFKGGAFGQARGHMLARVLGGSGDIPENLFTISQNPTNTPEMFAIEDEVYRRASAGQLVEYSVYLSYEDDAALVPSEIELQWFANGDEGGTILKNPAASQ